MGQEDVFVVGATDVHAIAMRYLLANRSDFVARLRAMADEKAAVALDQSIRANRRGDFGESNAFLARHDVWKVVADWIESDVERTLDELRARGE